MASTAQRIAWQLSNDWGPQGAREDADGLDHLDRATWLVSFWHGLGARVERRALPE